MIEITFSLLLFQKIILFDTNLILNIKTMCTRFIRNEYDQLIALQYFLIFIHLT